jgi:hypothetical protein
MIAAAEWILSLSTFAIVGAPLLLHPSFRFLPRGARLVLSGAVGAVLVCWLMVLESLATIPWNLSVLGGLGALCAALLRFLVPRRPADERVVLGAASSSTRARIASVVAAVAVGAVALCTLAGKTASPDILFHWGPKAQRFASARGIDAAYFHLPFHDYMRPDYPPLVPNLYAWATLMSGHFSWEAAIWLFPILLALTGVAAGGIMSLRLDDEARASGRAFLVATLGAIGIASTFGGIAEMPLLFFEVSGLALLLFGGTAPYQLLAGLCLAGATATKVEGAVVAFAAALAFAFLSEGRGTRVSALLRAGLPSALILATWLAFGNHTGLFHAYAGYGPLWEIYWSRIGGVMESIVRSASGFHLPGFLLPVLLLVTVRRWNRVLLIAPAVSIVLLAFLVFTYLHGGLDPGEWISWTATRVLSPITALLILTLARASATPRP